MAMAGMAQGRQRRMRRNKKKKKGSGNLPDAKRRLFNNYPLTNPSPPVPLG
jgi:hypothetical protein